MGPFKRVSRKRKNPQQNEKSGLFSPANKALQPKSETALFQKKREDVIHRAVVIPETEADKEASKVPQMEEEGAEMQMKEAESVQPYMTNGEYDEQGTNTERMEEDKRIQEMPDKEQLSTMAEEEQLSKMAEEEEVQQMEEEQVSEMEEEKVSSMPEKEEVQTMGEEEEAG